MEQSPLKILEQINGNWQHKISNKQTPCLVIEIKNGYQKIVRVVFIRYIKPKLDFFDKPLNALSIEG